MAKKKVKKAAKKAAAKTTAPAKADQKAASAPKTAASTAVLDAILKATGKPAPKKDETLQQFVERTCTAISELKDDEFAKLKEECPEALKWYDENLAFFNDEKFDKLVALPGMPGFVEPAGTAPEEAAATSTPAPAAAEEKKEQATPKSDEENDVAKKGKKGGAKKSTVKQTNGGSTERALRTDSTSYQIRAAVVKNPDVAFDKVCEKVGLKGKDASPTGHAHNMFQHAKIVMKIAAAEGYAKK